MQGCRHCKTAFHPAQRHITELRIRGIKQLVCPLHEKAPLQPTSTSASGAATPVAKVAGPKTLRCSLASPGARFPFCGEKKHGLPFLFVVVKLSKRRA